MTDRFRLGALRLILRLSAAVLALAAVAVFLPDTVLREGHASLVPAAYPDSPVYEYLARSISALYAIHGVLLWIVAADLVRFRPIAAWLGWASILFGAAMVWIDLAAGMPPWWSATEGPLTIATGGVVLVLLRAVPRADWTLKGGLA